MAGIAADCGRIGQVPAGHSLGTQVVMARSAGKGSRVENCVIELDRRHKTGGVMASATTQIGRNVRDRLTLYRIKIAVMATQASRFLHIHMAKNNACKARRRCGMAGIASSCTRNVIDWLGNRSTRVVLNVAGCAILWRAFEDAVDVASLATDELVRTTENKTGAQVIKRCTWLLRLRQINST